MANTNAEWLFVKRPDPEISMECFKMQSCDMPNLNEVPENHVVIKALYFSVDPYMRGRMNKENYFTPINEGDVFSGGLLGEIIASNHEKFPKGAVIQTFASWRKYMLIQPERTKAFIVPPNTQLTAVLGICGMTGLSAYFPVMEIGQPKAGEVAFVSGAAGAVGIAAGQFLKIQGCTVIGCAGSDDKLEVLKELGFDHVWNYKTTPLHTALKQFAPNGIDIYFDNVGGEFLDTTLVHMKKYGRVILCGAISQYNKKKEDWYGIKYLGLAITKELKLQGFISTTYANRMLEFQQVVMKLLAEGKLKSKETVVKGFDKLPQALIDLFQGGNVGKMLVEA